MPNSITSVSPQVQMTGLRNVPKYDPFLGLREAMLMQRAMQAAARRGGGGGSSVEGNPKYGYWVELPNGERKWAYGTSDKGRKESEAKIWADYRNRVLSADPEYKKATEGLAALSIPGQRERIDELKKMAPRLAPTLGLSEIDTVKYLTAEADKNVKARETEVDKAPGEFFASLGRGALDLWDSIAQIADTAPEQLARARASNAREREAAESNAFLDEIHRLEQEGRSSAGMRYGTLRGLRNLAGESLSSLGAMVAAQGGGAAAGAALGSAIAPGPGTLAGAIIGGATGGAVTGGPMGSFQFARSIADDDTISEADKIRMLEDNNAGLYGALAGGAFGAIPGGVVGLAGKGLVRVPGRIGQTATAFQIPSDTVRGAVARGVAQNAVDAAAMGAGFTVAGNQAYREATGRDIPLTAGLGDAIIGGALLGLPFGAARGFGARGRYDAWRNAEADRQARANPVDAATIRAGNFDPGAYRGETPSQGNIVTREDVADALIQGRLQGAMQDPRFQQLVTSSPLVEAVRSGQPTARAAEQAAQAPRPTLSPGLLVGGFQHLNTPVGMPRFTVDPRVAGTAPVTDVRLPAIPMNFGPRMAAPRPIVLPAFGNTVSPLGLPAGGAIPMRGTLPPLTSRAILLGTNTPTAAQGGTIPMPAPPGARRAAVSKSAAKSPIATATSKKALETALGKISDPTQLRAELDTLAAKNWKRKYIEARIGELTNGDTAAGADSSLIGQAPRLEPVGPEGERRTDNPDNPPGGPAATPAEATATAAPDQVPGALGRSRPADEIGGPNGTRPPDTGENPKVEAAPDEQGVSGAKGPDGESGAGPAAPASPATGESAGSAELAERPGASGAGDEPAVSAEQPVEPKPLDHPPVNEQEVEQVATLREDIADTPVEIRVQPTDTTEVAQAKVQKQLENGRRFDTAEAEAEVLTRLSGALSDAYDGAQTPAEIMSRVNFSFHEPTAEQIAKTVDRSLEQEAWHGTPNEIVGDQLSTDHIGSGEGAQVHGWGLYVALTEATARDRYQHRLSRNRRHSTDLADDVLYKGENLRKHSDIPVIKNLLAIYDDFALSGPRTAREILNDYIREYERRVRQYRKALADPLAYDLRYLGDPSIKLREASDGLIVLRQIEDKPIYMGERLRLEIPEDNVMLREDAPFYKQPEAVQKGIKEVAVQAHDLIQEKLKKGGLRWVEENALGDAQAVLTRVRNNDGKTPGPDKGEDIYDALVWAFGGGKEASQLLDKHGIKGIRYRGGTDGECAVLFDGKYARILERFYDQQGRGRIDFLNDGTARILFTDAADASTAIHEFQHFFLSEAGRLLSDPTVAESAAKQMLAKDIETLGRWAGEKENLSDPRLWSAEGHEKLAKAFEQYFREGKAPTPEMQSLFQKMKNFLVELYKKAKDLIGLSRLPKDIREVFARELTGYKVEDTAPTIDPERTLQSMGAVRDRLDFVDEDVLTKLMKDKDVFLAEDKAERLLARKALGEKLKPAEEKQVKALLKAMDYDSIELPPGELVNIRKQYGKAKEQGLDVSEAELLTKKTEDAQRKVNDDPACGV